MRTGIAADHGGFELKAQLTVALKAADYAVVDFDAHELVTGDDYPDFVVQLARAVARGDVTQRFGHLRRLRGGSERPGIQEHRQHSPLVLLLTRREFL